nr:MAG TPA: hypothetical protein [Caudoviricetes sp.]
MRGARSPVIFCPQLPSPKGGLSRLVAYFHSAPPNASSNVSPLSLRMPLITSMV